MKSLFFSLVFCLVFAESHGQNKEFSSGQDSLSFKKISLVESRTWCYIPSDTAFMFITNEVDFKKHDCRSKDLIDFTKFNYLLIYVNASGCKRHEVNLYLDKSIHTNENVLHLNITQFGYCAMSTHTFHSYLVLKEDCPYSPKIVRTIKIVDPR